MSTSILIDVGNTVFDWGYTWGYPDGESDKLFKIPIYAMTVRSSDNKSKEFRVYRFGVQKKTGEAAKIVGLADKQTHVVKNWIPDYPHDADPVVERGAWQIVDNYLIHDGPNDPKATAGHIFATIGCISICGPKKFTEFCETIVSWSNISGSSYQDKLIKLGSSGLLTVSYSQAKRPNLEPV